MALNSLTLQELFRLSFPEPVAWLSANHNSKLHADWVSVSLEETQAHDILILPTGQYSPEILSRARDYKAVAVLLVGLSLPLGAEFPDDFPVAAVLGQVDLRAVQRRLLTTLVDQRAGLIERGSSIHDQLSRFAIDGKGLDGLVRAMADLSGHSILVQDKRLCTLAEQPASALSGIWSEVTQPLSSLESLPEPMRDRNRAGKQPLVLKQEIAGDLERLVVPIRVSEVARGYLSIISLAGDLDTLDRLVGEQGALVCAVEMARSKAIREAEKRIKGNLLTAVLQANLSTRDARLWVQTMGLDLNQSHVALRFAWDDPSPPSRRRLETLVNGEVSRLGLKAIVNPMGSEIVCFCQLPRTSSRPDLALELGKAVLNREATEYPNIQVRCGIGTAAQDIDDWQVSFRQAGQALEMARRLGEREPLYFHDLSVYRLLMQIEHNPELMAFQEETLGPLLAYEGGQELIHTLEVFFEHHGNLSQTAEALYIHRNTLIYRMERIAEITKLDLNRPETRLGVQLALHIARMMGSR